MKTSPLLLLAMSFTLVGGSNGCATSAASATPASKPVRLNYRWSSVAELEAVLVKHTPIGTPLAEVQAFVKNRLVLDRPYSGGISVFPELGESYTAWKFSQPLAAKVIGVHLGQYAFLMTTDVTAYFFFGEDDRLLANKAEKINDFL